ncbi:MAG: PHP domain-containing protein [Bacillota bacterium]
MALRIIADLHTHTRYSHGRGSVLDNVAVALARGLAAVGITDHGPRSAPWVGASLRDFAAMRQEAAEVDRRAVGIRVLAGAECNIISAKGELDLPSELRSQLDLVLAGLHPGVLPASGRDWLLLTGNNWAAKFSPGLRRKARLINTEAVVQAVYQNEIDVITHPGYHLEIDTVELAKACADRETALEINARHGEMSVAYVRAAARQGVRFAINSDAHKPADVGHLTRGIAVAIAAGLEPEQVVNSDQGGLFEWLEAKRARRRANPRGWADWTEQNPLDRERREQQGRRDEPQKSYWTDWSQQGGKVH